MEQINKTCAVKTKKSNSQNEKTEKGTVSIRKRGNSFEARIRLELKNKVKGVDSNPRLSRSGQTEDLARIRLAQLIIETYIITSNYEVNEGPLFSEECEKNLESFKEYGDAKEDALIHKGLHSNLDFGTFATIWLNHKKAEIKPSTGKPIGYKTVESYVSLLKKHIIPNFSQYTIPEATQEVIETYINSVRKDYPRIAKDVFLMIRQILNYAKTKKLIEEVPEFNLKFPKKKRSKKTKIVYIPAERQSLWLDTLENDGRDFCKLFATLLQTGMRPEEGCGFLLSQILFDKNTVYVGNAKKDVIIYDQDFNVIKHKYIDDELKTEESYREVPMSKRLKSMFLDIYNTRKNLRKSQGKKFDPSKEYAFLNANGEPYLPERLDKKLKSIIKKYGLEHMTVYGFRHSFATLMSELGMDREVLREIMGHSDFETTDFYYIYISDKRKQTEFKKISEISFDDIYGTKSDKTSTPSPNIATKKTGYTGLKIARKKALLKLSA